MIKSEFATQIAENVFRHKFALTQNESWKERCRAIVRNVCGRGNDNTLSPLLAKEEREALVKYMSEFKFIPGGRYIYYSGREAKFYNNCYLLKGLEDTREEWARLCHAAMSTLSCGGGIGIDYSIFREKGRVLRKTGGIASGPIALMKAINEIGRNVQQGGSRRSAMYASLNWQHPDADEFLHVKDWHTLKIEGTDLTVSEAKKYDFDYHAPLDMTNISLNYDDAFLDELYSNKFGLTLPKTFLSNVKQALMTGEPGFSFNFRDKQNETLRNACTEVTSEDDSDVCNLGSINIGAIETLKEFQEVVQLASKFLVCGTIRAELPYAKVYEVREKNRRLGLGLMGIHAWLIKRNYKYEVNEELRQWLMVYKHESEWAANEHCDRLYLSRPVAYRSIAPTGTIAILGSTTSGIEPLYSVAYKRRYLSGSNWKYEYVIDATAEHLIQQCGIKPDDIETATELAFSPERRIKFQADIQDYVDMAISSTINLPEWNTKGNWEGDVGNFAYTLAKYAPRLRGFTCYPSGSRGGQPLNPVPYEEAKKNQNIVFEETSEMSCKSGVCGA